MQKKKERRTSNAKPESLMLNDLKRKEKVKNDKGMKQVKKRHTFKHDYARLENLNNKQSKRKEKKGSQKQRRRRQNESKNRKKKEILYL